MRSRSHSIDRVSSIPRKPPTRTGCRLSASSRTATVAAEGRLAETATGSSCAQGTERHHFGIARPIGDSLREIRRASVRNLGLGLLVIGLAFVGIIPISHRMTQHLASLTQGGASSRAATSALGGRAIEGRVWALAGAFNQMAADLERHEALMVHQALAASSSCRVSSRPRCCRRVLRSGPAELRLSPGPKSAETSSTTSYCPTAGWLCSSAMCRARA